MRRNDRPPLFGCILLACVLSAWTGGASPATPAPTNATEIVRRSDDLLRGAKSYARIVMEVTRPRWSRRSEMEAWTMGTDFVFISVLAPAKDRGVKFLKRGREAWNYIPAVDRTVKLPPSMMLQSWMGSDFSNDDVVRADSTVVDYTSTAGGPLSRLEPISRRRSRTLPT